MFEDRKFSTIAAASFPACAGVFYKNRVNNAPRTPEEKITTCIYPTGC